MKLDFSVAVHSLLFMKAHSGELELTTSKQLAKQMNVNAVLVRNTLSLLHKKGYIMGKVGKSGGYHLVTPFDDINVGDLYDLTIPPILSYARFITGDIQKGNPKDKMATNMNETLSELFTLADKQYRAFYHQFTMTDLERDIAKHGYIKAKEATQ